MILPKYLQEELNLYTGIGITGVEAFAYKLTSRDELVDILYCFDGLACVFKNRGYELFGTYSVYLEGDNTLNISDPTYLELAWESSKSVLLKNESWDTISKGFHLIYLHEFEKNKTNYTLENPLYLIHTAREITSGDNLIPESFEYLDDITGDFFELELTIKYKDSYYAILHIRENRGFYINEVINEVVDFITLMLYDIIPDLTLIYNLEVYSKAKIKGIAFKNKILF